MATHHAASGELVDLKNWADDLLKIKSKVITKTSGLEIARLVIEAGVNMHNSDYCSVRGVSVFHCIEGKVQVKTPDELIDISPGQLVYLDAGVEHALIGLEDSVVLLSIVL